MATTKKKDTSARNAKKWGWRSRLVALFVSPIIVFGGLESVLRLSGYGYDPSFLVQDAEDPSMLRDNREFFWSFFPKALARSAQPIRIAKQKPDGTYRIVVLGGSAVMGDPEPAYGPPRLLAVLLEQRFPNKRFEVINAAVTAINSHVVFPIMRDCMRLDPDAMIVYMGNNEVHGPFGSGTVFGDQAPPMWSIRFGLGLKKTKIGQLLVSLTSGGNSDVPKNWGGLEMFTEQRVPWGDPKLERVYNHFERNLRDMIKMAKAHDVPMLVSTAAVNLKDSSPFLSEGESASANHAESQFQLAKGSPDNAREAFERARDLDALRFRADSRLNEILSQFSLDAEVEFAKASPSGIPGEELFWEHVHFNLEGSYLLARVFGDGLVDALELDDSSAWPSMETCLKQLGVTSFHHHAMVLQMRERLGTPPFSNQSCHASRDKRLQALEEMLAGQMETLTAQTMVAETRALIEKSPEDWVLRAQYASFLAVGGQSDAAIMEWKHITEQLPHYPKGFVQLGGLLQRAGKWKEVEPILRQALELQSNNVRAIHDLAVCLSNQEAYDEAYEHFANAVRIMPNYPEAHVDWGLVLASQGQALEAVERFREALSHAPDHLGAHYHLGRHFARSSELGLAEKHHLEVVRLAPDDVAARMDLAFLYLKQNKVAQGVEQLQHAVALDPNNEKARAYLEKAMSLPQN